MALMYLICLFFFLLFLSEILIPKRGVSLLSDDIKEQKKLKRKIKYLHFTYYSILIVFLSYITNFGWVRVVYGLQMILHIIIVITSANLYHKYNDNKSNFMNLASIFICLTLVIFHVTLGDTGDTSESARVFFGLIRDNQVMNTLDAISSFALSLNLFFLIYQLIYAFSLRKKHKYAEVLNNCYSLK